MVSPSENSLFDVWTTIKSLLYRLRITTPCASERTTPGRQVFDYLGGWSVVGKCISPYKSYSLSLSLMLRSAVCMDYLPAKDSSTPHSNDTHTHKTTYSSKME